MNQHTKLHVSRAYSKENTYLLVNRLNSKNKVTESLFKLIKHHIPNDNTTGTLHCDMNIIAFCITPTESNNLKNYSSNNQDDDKKNNQECFVSVEVRDPEDLEVRKLKRDMTRCYPLCKVITNILFVPTCTDYVGTNDHSQF